ADPDAPALAHITVEHPAAACAAAPPVAFPMPAPEDSPTTTLAAPPPGRATAPPPGLPAEVARRVGGGPSATAPDGLVAGRTPGARPARATPGRQAAPALAPMLAAVHNIAAEQANERDADRQAGCTQCGDSRTGKTVLAWDGLVAGVFTNQAFREVSV